MAGAGMFELATSVVVFLFILGLMRRGSSFRIGGPTLVLRKFIIHDHPQDGVLVEVIGRASGVMAWLLTVLGFDAETRLTVSDKGLAFNSSSLFGQIVQTAPFQSVSSTHCGYSKPIGLLMLGAFFVFGGLFSSFGRYGSFKSFLIGLIIGGIFLAIYYFSKKMAISFETTGGMMMGMSFKRSAIENVDINIEKVKQAIELINTRVAETQR